MSNGMPDLGAPSTLPSLPSSHTSTQQWQSFEIRMRYRRAERCVIRAEVALEAGFEEDARAALDEARRLNSGSPDLETVRATVTARLASRAADRRARLRRRAASLAAAALLVFATGITAFWMWDGEPSAAQTAAATAPPPEAPPAAAATNTAAPAPVATAGDAAATPKEPATSEPQKTAAPVTEEARGSEQEPDATSPPKPPVAERKAVALPVADRTTPAAPEPAPRSDTPSPALAAPAATIAAAPPEAESIERLVETLPVASVGSVPRRDEPAGADEPSPAVEEPRVRAALARYESAYSGLNASAAQAVWPGVDERSLARAFDTLESQRVSLGRCSVQVHDTTARADCSGSVTFTPKVGGGTQTQPRQWSFELAQANGAWQITRAEAK